MPSIYNHTDEKQKKFTKLKGRKKSSKKKVLEIDDE